ncbi:hypothetical protein JXB31_03145 [Candidatus Woesearchaeota archaeon]|nr:hypothetical protein [Candidatus Woesearchaeota archaeon]
MVSSEMLKKYGFSEEELELARNNPGDQVFGPTGFPKPNHKYRVMLEAFNKSIEEVYFWVNDNIMISEGFANVKKITDIFSASEQSSFFGTAQQRIGMQQEKVSMFLATIGKMVKELFQLVREIRILDERMSYYKDSNIKDSPSRESAEITLKGIWIDMVEQGAKNPASVYGMARELQFTTLPDLFFSIHPHTVSEIDSTVEALDFNRKVKEVLKRKLRTFMEWKRFTYEELNNRRTFTLKYLRQHFDVIKMYMSWVKPYLRNIRRMELADRSKSNDLISAFEQSIVEIETLYYKLPPSHGEAKEMKFNKYINSVVVATFYYRTRPSMNYQQEYQRGPLHVGRVDVTLRAYAWSNEEIEKYLKMKEEEDLSLLVSIDESVKAAMEALGDDLEAYLKEAGEAVKFEKQDKESLKDAAKRAADPFTSIVKGFGESFSALKGGKKEKVPSKAQIENEKNAAKSNAKRSIWMTYKNFKKSHGLLAW